MKKVQLAFLIILFLSIFAKAEKITIELNNALLSTAVESIAKLQRYNIIWDKDAMVLKNRLVSISIQKPVDDLKVLNMILLQNGLILVKDNRDNLFYIKEADEFYVALPLDIVSFVGIESFLKLVDYIKSIKTEYATFDYNQSAYSIYYKDTKENIIKVKIFADSYVRYLVYMGEKQQEIIKKQQEMFEKKGKPIRREFKMSYEDFKDIEHMILDSLSSFGRAFYDKSAGKLVITDFNENLQNITPLISKKLKSKIVTKCFYVREIEPGEVYNNIKYSELSEIGSITFKFKSVDIATILTKSGEPPQVLQVPKQLKTGEQVEEKQLSSNLQPFQQESLPQQQTQQTVRGDYLISKLPRICISDYPEVIDKIKYKYNDVLLERPYQIQIEARIVEVSSDSIKDLGIQWGGQGLGNNFALTGTNSPSSMITNSKYAVDFPATNSSLGQGFSFGFVFGNMADFLDVRLSALQRVGKTKLLSAPKVLTSDGETAIIRQGFEIPYIVNVSATSPGNVQFKNAVMQLKVTPFTFIDNTIMLNIELSKDEPDFAKQVQGVPPIMTKTIINRVSVKDGQIVVIGGILEKKESETNAGVPGLMNIPILGNLFKSRYKQSNSTELLIFISPKIVYE